VRARGGESRATPLRRATPAPLVVHHPLRPTPPKST